MNNINNNDLLEINAGGYLKTKVSLIGSGLITAGGGYLGSKYGQDRDSKVAGYAGMVTGGVFIVSGILY